MKKYWVIFMILIMFFLVSCKPEGEESLPEKEDFEETPINPDQPVETEAEIKEIIEDYLNTIVLPETTKENLFFLDKVIYLGKEIVLDWETDHPALTSKGIVTREFTDVTVHIAVTGSIGEVSVTKEMGSVIVLSYGQEIFTNVVNELTILEEVGGDIFLPTLINGVRIVWATSDKNILDKNGKYSYVPVDTYVTLSATLIFGEHDEYIDSKEFIVLVKTYPNQTKLELVAENISFPSFVEGDLVLPTEFDYGVSGSWKSSNNQVIASDGTVTLTNKEETVVMTLTLASGGETLDLVFEVKTKIMVETERKLSNHILVDRAESYLEANMVNVEVKNGKLVLVEGATEGYYQSLIYNTKSYTELVASWAAISSTTSTCELEIRVKADTAWSKYFTYGVWGLGRNNLYYNQTDTRVRMNTDEILLNSPYKGKAFQYKITLRRNTADVASPVLSLVAVTLNIENYTYAPSTAALPAQVDYDVPKLNQNEVPEIGNSICSPTTSTMLLKFKGFNFTDKDAQYEHRYIAGLVADRGHNNPTYGNWVYNTVTMGAFGLDAYVQRMYSWSELKYHLATVGPVGASIKGNTGLYTTGGHLIVVRGYKEINGKTYVICNDPNINSRFGAGLFVYYEFPLDVFENFWRGVVYVVE
ncbi:MAG: C39 family peptidase [Bacilli bacterium]|jgi:hypothetical protein|nr:C39 family peptidase [Bacilli bacterium]HOE06777.1 C39 family peptidase [Bacilli bacterium]